MGSLTMSASGLTDLTKDEGSVDGLYDDPSGYATFGVGHLVHSDKASGFFLAAAKANTTWNGKLGTAYTTVKYVPRTAVSWSDWADFKTNATDLAVETLAKKKGKDPAKLSDTEKAEFKTAAEQVIRIESDLLAKTPSDVLKGDLGSYETAVNTKITGVTLTQEEFDALVSLCFNIGVGNFSTASLVTRINENKYRSGDKVVDRETAMTAIETAFGTWNKSGGVVLAGLTTRRANEAARFLKGAKAEVEEMKKKAAAAAPVGAK
jgi:GH24 family phage-related lysozyme (muramidase)